MLSRWGIRRKIKQCLPQSAKDFDIDFFLYMLKHVCRVSRYAPATITTETSLNYPLGPLSKRENHAKSIRHVDELLTVHDAYSRTVVAFAYLKHFFPKLTYYDALSQYIVEAIKTRYGQHNGGRRYNITTDEEVRSELQLFRGMLAREESFLSLVERHMSSFRICHVTSIIKGDDSLSPKLKRDYTAKVQSSCVFLSCDNHGHFADAETNRMIKQFSHRAGRLLLNDYYRFRTNEGDWKNSFFSLGIAKAVKLKAAKKLMQLISRRKDVFFTASELEAVHQADSRLNKTYALVKKLLPPELPLENLPKEREGELIAELPPSKPQKQTAVELSVTQPVNCSREVQGPSQIHSAQTSVSMVSC